MHPQEDCEGKDVRSGSTLSGIEFYPAAGTFPPMYRNALFFADRLRSCIWALLPDATGIPKKGSVVPFAGMAKRATDLEVTPQGDLLYIDQSVDQIRRIRYTPPNNAPVAVATASATSGNAPLAVTFSGLASTDADGDALTYAWDLDGDNLLDDSTAAQPTFNYTTPGTYTVTLKVTDADGAFSTAAVVIKVNAAPKAVATASATSGTAPLAVTFSGLGSTDAEGDALTYAWDLDGDTQLDDSTAAQPSFNYTTPGTYTVTLKVTDTTGAAGTATVAITVNAAPKAVATASTTSGTAPLAVAFNGLASTDADGDALTYAWDLDGDTQLDDAVVAQPAFIYTTPGTYTVTLRVNDNKGASSTATVAITVQAPAPDPDPGPGPRTSPFVPIGAPGTYVEGTTLSGLIQDVSVSQSAQAGQPANAAITTALAKGDGSHPSATFEMAVHLPAGMTRNTTSFATCDPASLKTHGPPGCPAGSVIGAGSAAFDAWPVVVDYVDAQVTIFNGTAGSVLARAPGAWPGLRRGGSRDGRLCGRVRGSPDPHRGGRTARRAREADARLPIVRLPDEPGRLPDGGLHLGIRLSLRERREDLVVAAGPVHGWFAGSGHNSSAARPPVASGPRRCHEGQDEAICACVRPGKTGHRQAVRAGFDERGGDGDGSRHHQDPRRRLEGPSLQAGQQNGRCEHLGEAVTEALPQFPQGHQARTEATQDGQGADHADGEGPGG